MSDNRGAWQANRGNRMSGVATAAAVLALGVGVVFLAIPRLSPDTETRTRVEGAVKYVEQIGPDGELHGMQRIYVDDRLVSERVFERGFLMESTEYAPDGSVKSHQEHEL